MPRKFSTQVALVNDLTTYTFGPGDDVPEWATDLGEHVLQPLKGEDPEEADDSEDAADEDTPQGEVIETVVEEEQGTPAPSAVDFTKPAQPIKRGPGRPRKN